MTRTTAHVALTREAKDLAALPLQSSPDHDVGSREIGEPTAMSEAPATLESDNKTQAFDPLG